MTEATGEQVDERAPLLGTKTATGDVEAAVVRDSDGAPTEEPLAGEEPTKKTGAWTIAWYILLTVVVVVGIELGCGGNGRHDEQEGQSTERPRRVRKGKERAEG